MSSPESFVLQVSQPFQNVRLLELPDELLELITNAESETQRLFLKSSTNASDSNASQEGNLHLCSNDEAWLVKQVSTSNSIYLTRADGRTTESTRYTRADEDTDVTMKESDILRHDIITAFAKPSSILELHSVREVDCDTVAERELKRLLPILQDPEHPTKPFQASATMKDRSELQGFSRNALFNEIPAPSSSIQRALSLNCVFEVPLNLRDSLTSRDRDRSMLDIGTQTVLDSQSVRAYIPGTSLLLETWRTLVEAAIISDTKITPGMQAHDLLLESRAISKSSHKADDVLPLIARAMFERNGYFEAIGLISRGPGTDSVDHLNDMDLARWVGNLILKEAEEKRTSFEKEQFEKQWEDAVPANLVKYCSIEILGSSCITQGEENNQIGWQEFALADKPAAISHTAGKPAASMGKGKRKWHDKFAATRAAKK